MTKQCEIIFIRVTNTSLFNQPMNCKIVLLVVIFFFCAVTCKLVEDKYMDCALVTCGGFGEEGFEVSFSSECNTTLCLGKPKIMVLHVHWAFMDVWNRYSFYYGSNDDNCYRFRSGSYAVCSISDEPTILNVFSSMEKITISGDDKIDYPAFLELNKLINQEEKAKNDIKRLANRYY